MPLRAPASHSRSPSLWIASDCLSLHSRSDVQHVVFARSVLEDVYDRVGNNHRKKGRLRALYRDTRRSSACFDDVHCRELLPSVQALSGKRWASWTRPLPLSARASPAASRSPPASPCVSQVWRGAPPPPRGSGRALLVSLRECDPSSGGFGCSGGSTGPGFVTRGSGAGGGGDGRRCGPGGGGDVGEGRGDGGVHACGGRGAWRLGGIRGGLLRARLRGQPGGGGAGGERVAWAAAGQGRRSGRWGGLRVGPCRVQSHAWRR